MKRAASNPTQQQKMELVTAKIALQTMFPEETINNVLKVVNATGNTPVGVLILLGQYEAPELPHYLADTKDEANIEFISYDPFTDLVKYSYNRIRTKSAWFKKDDEPTEENIQDKSSWREDAMSRLNFKGNSSDFEALYTKKVYQTNIDDDKSTTTISSDSWLNREVRHEESFALAE